MKNTNKMRNLLMKFGMVAASLALMLTIYDVNVCCTLFAHQDKLPEGAKKLRKF